MIFITRATDPDEILEMVEHFTLPGEDQIKVMHDQIMHALRHTPERVLILQARRDSGELLAFVVAETGVGTTAQIAQAWSGQSTPWSVANNLFARVRLWALSLGKTEIEVTTTRSTESLYRRFGFVEASKNLIHKLDQSLYTSLVKTVLAEDQTNGKPVQETRIEDDE